MPVADRKKLRKLRKAGNKQHPDEDEEDSDDEEEESPEKLTVGTPAVALVTQSDADSPP